MYSKSILRGFIAELHHLGVFEEIKARASPELLPLLIDPGSAPSWQAVAPLDEINTVLGALLGRGAVRDLGYRTLKEGGLASVLEPIIHLTIAVMGSNPGSLFARMQLMASVISRGLELGWRPVGSTAGVITIRCDERVPEMSWGPWEGALRYPYDLTGYHGEVAQARPAADGRSCEIDVSWTAR
jgi:hypothetical protein